MAQLRITRIHGKGWGSSRFKRNTNARGSETTPIKPVVAATPTRAQDQKSATISEIHRSHICQGKRSSPLPTCRARNSGRNEGTKSSSAAA